MIEKIREKIQILFFTRAQQQAFMEDTSTLIEDGVPINQAVDTYRQMSTGINRDMANHIMNMIAQGKTLADGMRGWFPPPIVEIIRAGEQGGTLPQTMASAAKALSQESYVLSSLIGSTVYPIAVIILGFIVSIFVKNSVYVNFSLIKPIASWPANGKFLYMFATFLEHWWWTLIVGALALVAILFTMLRDLTGEIRKFIDDIPVLSIYREVYAARFMESLGLLLSNGVTLKNGLSILYQGANRYLSWHLLLMEYRLSSGIENIAEVLDTGLISRGDILRLKVIARSKGFEHALMRLGNQSAIKNSKTIQLTAKIMGGIFLTIGAGYAAFMVFAIYDVGTFVGT